MKNFLKNLKYLSFYELRVPITIIVILLTIITGTITYSISSKTKALDDVTAKYTKETTKLKAPSTKEGTGKDLAEGYQPPKIDDANVSSEYTNNSIIAKLNTALSTALTYKSSKDLTNAYTELKDTLKGTFWNDIYGTVKPQNTPAIDQFATTIDEMEKTASPSSIKIFQIDDTHYKAIVVEKLDGNEDLRAPTGTNIYHFDIEYKDDAYNVSLTNILS